MELIDPLEILWDALLSRQPEKIRAAFNGLDENSRRNVLIHLKKMATEKDWHPEQVKSAREALSILNETKQE